MSIEIRTTATSGLFYMVIVYAPKSVKDNKNVTLHFKLEKVSLGLSRDSSGKELFKFDHIFLDPVKTTDSTKYTPPGEPHLMYLRRDVKSEDVETKKLDIMPGFRCSWWYTGAQVTQDDNYKDDELTKQFFRLAES